MVHLVAALLVAVAVSLLLLRFGNVVENTETKTFARNFEISGINEISNSFNSMLGYAIQHTYNAHI